ncbi:BTB domain-containing protein [Caenorhabditis elegans]|uniref:BTB domain-containing protein n=1 Tax=Caenorhabditis elegans TaxID=6239 RepID=O16740_CAEEL|nr:BTB domain-containing protein [Caenorhabditis elegans]CCD71262.1 BTB domain-containing protein [Caenorhabditis elegans]|eukprot:NP_494053.1 BTB (Broad/complex/Tramtrack/Bric a brac) domain protein [Caenorhabditis elegans]
MEEVINYRSDLFRLSDNLETLHIEEKFGIKCDLTCKIEENMTTFEFQFDLRDFKNNGFKQLTAEITIRPDPENPIFELIHRKLDILDIDEHRVNFSVENKNTQSLAETRAILELILTPIREKFSYREMFMPSQKTDAILMIGGEKLHVNKAFLSFHSDFFHELFSASSTESEIPEIPIRDVSAEDMGLLLSTIYPDLVFPTDKTAAKLLTLANRFQMRAVTAQVEHHLLWHSDIEIEKLILMANTFGMKDLLKECTCDGGNKTPGEVPISVQ